MENEFYLTPAGGKCPCGQVLIYVLAALCPCPEVPEWVCFSLDSELLKQSCSAVLLDPPPPATGCVSVSLQNRHGLLLTWRPPPAFSAAIIEHVRDGSVVRALLLPDYYLVTVMLSGIKVKPLWAELGLECESLMDENHSFPRSKPPFFLHCVTSYDIPAWFRRL